MSQLTREMKLTLRFKKPLTRNEKLMLTEENMEDWIDNVADSDRFIVENLRPTKLGHKRPVDNLMAEIDEARRVLVTFEKE